MIKSIIFTVSAFWTSSLADFSLSCHPLTPTCPGTVVHCQCNGAAGSLTWNVSSERSSCIVWYNAINTMTDGDCNATTTTVSVDTNDTNLFIFNSNLTINLTERVTVSCANISKGVVQTTLDLAGTKYYI